MSDFDPFSDARPTRADWRKRLESATVGDDFDPWGEGPRTPKRDPRAGLELPGDAPGLGSMWDGADASAQAEGTPNRGGSILVVCTGNVCRSPYIHLRLAEALNDLGIDVSSAGTGALVGRPVDPGSAALLDAAHVDSSAFRARQLTAQLVQDADLVLTATHSHRRQVVQEVPAALRKTFALTDFADLVEGLQLDDLATVRGCSLVSRVASAAADRRHLVHARTDEDADIVDPFRRGADVFAQMERQTMPSLDVVVNTLRRVGDR